MRLAYLTHWGRGRIKAPLSSTGDFVLTVPGLKTGTPAVLEYAGQRTSLYLSPGDRLGMSLDYARFDQSVRYTGDGANANNYLARSLWQFESSPPAAGPRPRDEQTSAFSPAQMRRCADAFREKRKAFLTAWDHAHPLPPSFRAAAIVHLDLQWVLALLEYPVLHNQRKHETTALPASYYAFLSQLPPHTLDLFPRRDRGYEDNGLVASCLLAYGYRLVPTGRLSADPAEARRIYLLAIQEVGHVAADVTMQLFISQQLQTQGNWTGALAAYSVYRVLSRDSTGAQRLRGQISRRQSLQPGQLAPDFTLVDHTGQAVSLTSLRGKVVYLDFWGTWCKPCLAEMPASLALRQQFVTKEVVFVYVDVTDTKAAWQKVLATSHLTGGNSIHVRSPDNVVPSAYQVGAYPRYVLIGRDGRIALPVAPRPSAAVEATTAIEAALTQRP